MKTQQPLVRVEDANVATLDELVDAARAYAVAARSANTREAYASDWRHFDQWARGRGFEPMPADPAVVALYLTDLAATMKPSTIARRVASISVVHQEAGHPSPTSHESVRLVLAGIRRTVGVAQRRARPIQLGDLRSMLAFCPDSTAGIRDRALLLVGFAGALRRSELVALNVDDLDRRDEGIVVRLRKSKTDQEGEGRDVALPFGRDPFTCPVTALDRWLEEASVEQGAVFRSVSRHGRVGERLSPTSVNVIVKAAASRARIDNREVTGHSLRAGFATTAAAAGAPERTIAAQTGHRSMTMLRRYVRHSSIFTDNASTMVGL